MMNGLNELERKAAEKRGTAQQQGTATTEAAAGPGFAPN